LASIEEIYNIAEIRFSTSNWGEIQYIPNTTLGKLQGSNEGELTGTFLQGLPLRIRGGQIEQNLLIFNFYPIKQHHICDSREYNLESFISRRISEITAVEYIFTSKEENILQVWIIINELDREVRDRIYDIEYDILEHFKDIYFDFHVVCRNDRDMNELFPCNSIMIYRWKE